MMSTGLRRKRRRRKLREICKRAVWIVPLSIMMTVFLTAGKQRCGDAVPTQEYRIRLPEEMIYSDGKRTNKVTASDGKEENLISGNKESRRETSLDGNRETGKYVFSEEEREDCRRIIRQNEELCVLVNKEKELDPLFDSHLRSICDGRLLVSDWMYQDLTKMLQAAVDAGYDYWIASAYRSRERQQELVDEDVAALMRKGKSRADALEETLRETMPAGHSEHETGLALDILCSENTNMDESQAGEPANQWLVSHCSEYGFILRYPKDKESVTGIAWEPWHFRYVGREAARYMTEYGLTLEEFCAAACNKDEPA